MPDTKSKSDYNKLISESIKEMYRVLKFDRWMSFVFAHKDPEFWHLIIDTAEQCGFEYVGAVPQKNGQSSFKKRQNPFTVLSGQLIINFKKVRTPKAMMKAHLGMETAEMVIQTIEGVIANNDGATIEQINDELILKGLELGFLDLLKKEYTDLTPILKNNFDYDSSTQKYQLRKNTAFSTHIDVNMRIRYILRSFLVRMERERQKVTFDDIILNVIPLLRNGSTPENQTVLKVLEDIGQRSGDNYWTLKNNNPTSPIIYCNYKRISSTLILIAEFFIPSLGHFLAGKYIMGIIKLSLLLIIPILSLIIGFSFYYKDSTHGEEYKKIELSRDNNEENDNNLHIANREEKKMKNSTLLPVIICFVSLSLFLLMHIFDLICYLFSFYNDGYGAPFV